MARRTVLARGRVVGRARRNVGEKESAVSNIVFSLLQDRAKSSHWKSPFEVTFVLASKANGDRPIPREAVRDIVQALLQAINFYHAGAMVIDLDAMEARPHRGEPAAYASFDGYKLVIGSTGYAA